MSLKTMVSSNKNTLFINYRGNKSKTTIIIRLNNIFDVGNITLKNSIWNFK